MSRTSEPSSRSSLTTKSLGVFLSVPPMPEIAGVTYSKMEQACSSVAAVVGLWDVDAAIDDSRTSSL